MIERMMKLLSVESWISTEWYKNGEKAPLRTMRVFGALETGAVRISRYYRTPLLQVRVVRWVYLGGAKMGMNDEVPGEYRVVSSCTKVTLGSRAGRPLVSVHLPPRVRRMAGKDAVRMLQGILEEHTDLKFTTCTLHR